MKDKNMKKFTIKLENPIKRRDFIAMDLLTNPLYRQKIVKSKKIYDRKKLKPIKQILVEK